MRSHGTVSGARDLGVHDHICWTYTHRDDFLRAGLDYLADGRALGQRLVYVADRDEAGLRRDLQPLGDVDAMVDEGALALFPLTMLYDLTTPIVPEQQLATYAAAIDDAIRAGYAGLRVLADATALVTDPARRPEHARWEHLADGYMSERPFSAMCGYDRRAVGADGVQDIGCVHPLAHAPVETVPFMLFVDDGELVIAGDVDAIAAPLLDRSLARTPIAGEVVAIRLSELAFISHQGLVALASFGRRLAQLDARLELRGAPRIVHHVWHATGLDRTDNVEMLVGSGT